MYMYVYMYTTSTNQRPLERQSIHVQHNTNPKAVTFKETEVSWEELEPTSTHVKSSSAHNAVH